MRGAAQPDGRVTRAYRRLVETVLSPLQIVATGMVIIVGIADGWRSALLCALAASMLAAMRVRFSARFALGLLMVAALLAIGGWGPGFDRRSPAHPVPSRAAHIHPKTGGAKR